MHITLTLADLRSRLACPTGMQVAYKLWDDRGVSHDAPIAFEINGDFWAEFFGNPEVSTHLEWLRLVGILPRPYIKGVRIEAATNLGLWEDIHSTGCHWKLPDAGGVFLKDAVFHNCQLLGQGNSPSASFVGCTINNCDLFPNPEVDLTDLTFRACSFEFTTIPEVVAKGATLIRCAFVNSFWPTSVPAPKGYRYKSDDIPEGEVRFRLLLPTI